MAELTEIRVEVAYARPDVQRLLTIVLLLSVFSTT